MHRLYFEIARFTTPSTVRFNNFTESQKMSTMWSPGSLKVVNSKSSQLLQELISECRYVSFFSPPNDADLFLVGYNDSTLHLFSITNPEKSQVRWSIHFRLFLFPCLKIYMFLIAQRLYPLMIQILCRLGFHLKEFLQYWGLIGLPSSPNRNLSNNIFHFR